jgi:hypothetical protein
MDSVRATDVSRQARAVAAMPRVARRPASRIRMPDVPHGLAPRRLVKTPPRPRRHLVGLSRTRVPPGTRAVQRRVTSDTAHTLSYRR